MNRGATGLALLAALLSASCARDAGVPPGLVGRWSARDGRHAGLAFEVRCTAMLLKQTHGFDVFRITSTTIDSTGPETAYEIDVDLQNGGTDRIRLARDKAHPDILYMGRSRQPWLRDPDAPVPWGESDSVQCSPALDAQPASRSSVVPDGRTKPEGGPGSLP